MTRQASTHVTFALDRETKNTARFAEVVPAGGRPVVGMLYIQKWAFQGQEIPKQVKVSIALPNGDDQQQAQA